MEYSTWIYSPCEDWYVRYATYYMNGDKYARKEIANYYYGETNIPRVKRKSKY